MLTQVSVSVYEHSRVLHVPAGHPGIHRVAATDPRHNKAADNHSGADVVDSVVPAGDAGPGERLAEVAVRVSGFPVLRVHGLVRNRGLSTSLATVAGGLI